MAARNQGDLDPLDFGKALASLPATTAAATSRPDPGKVHNGIEAALFEATLVLASCDDNADAFVDRHERLQQRIEAIEADVQALRYEWARVAVERLGLSEFRILLGEHGERKSSSAHLAAYEYCRQVMFTAWTAIDPAAVEKHWPNRPEFTAERVRKNWPAVRKALADFPGFPPDEFSLGMEAELGGIIEESQEAKLTPDEQRQKFCFEERRAGKTYKEINAALRRHPTWEDYDSDLSVRSAIVSWEKRTGQSLPKRNSGRRREA